MNTLEYVLKQKGHNNEELKARSAFRVGMELYGYCGGVFGRDSYGTKTIIKISEDDILVKEENGIHNLANVLSWVDLLESSNRALIYG